MALNQLLGVVICGGKSSRMGTDKGLIPINDTCWAKFIGDKLSAAGLPLVVSVNASQTVKYQAIFKPDQLVIDNLEINGPLAGLLSVHSEHPDNDLLLLACDMIDMQAETLNRLIKTYLDEPDPDFYVYRNAVFFEPFCAIYTACGLKKLLKQYEAPSLSGMSLQKVFSIGLTRQLVIVDPSSFANYNKLSS